MKILKYLFLLLLIVVVGILIFTAVQPNAYNVKRTKVIQAPVGVVYNQIIDIKNWDNWGPWHDEDSTIVTTYPGKTIGVGAKSTWTSKDGPGNMELIAAVPNQSVDLKMQFYDYKPSDVYWQFKEIEKGTEVTWGMKNDETPFIFKFLSAFSGGMEKMLGEMEENGLNNLDNVVQQQLKSMPKPEYKLSKIETINLPSQQFIGYYQKTTTDMNPEDFTKIFMEYMPIAGKYAASKLKPDDYIPGAVYTKWDEENNEAEFYVGVLLKKNIAPKSGMTAINLPEGNSVKLKKYGEYGKGDYEAHTEIGKYLEANQLQMNGETIWELYVNDPTTVKPTEIETDIYYPIQ